MRLGDRPGQEGVGRRGQAWRGPGTAGQASALGHSRPGRQTSVTGRDGGLSELRVLGENLSCWSLETALSLISPGGRRGGRSCLLGPRP